MAPQNQAPRKRPLSDAQIQANRDRAKKSTGPSTFEGKQRSSQNSLKHGQCAQTLVLMPGEDANALHQFSLATHLELLPRGAIETCLVEQVVAGAVGVQRCLRAEAAEAHKRAELFVEEQEHTMLCEVEDLIAALPERPRVVVHQLRSTSAGCRWLLARWESLRDSLDAGFWQDWEMHLALRLWGFRPSDWVCDLEARALLLAIVSTNWDWPNDEQGAEKGLESDLRGAMRPAELAADHEFQYWIQELALQLTERPAARAWLFERVDAELAALEELRARRQEQEEQQRQRASAHALVDTTKEGALRHRYLMAHRRMMRDALKELVALKKAKIESQDFGRAAYTTEEELAEGIRQAEEAAAQAAALAEEASARNEPEEDASDGDSCRYETISEGLARAEGPSFGGSDDRVVSVRASEGLFGPSGASV
jgi:hypothetical protein